MVASPLYAGFRALSCKRSRRFGLDGDGRAIQGRERGRLTPYELRPTALMRAFGRRQREPVRRAVGDHIVKGTRAAIVMRSCSTDSRPLRRSSIGLV